MRLPSILFVNVTTAKMKVILQIGLPFNVISKKRISKQGESQSEKFAGKILNCSFAELKYDI